MIIVLAVETSRPDSTMGVQTRTSKPFFDDPDMVKVKHRFRLRRLIPNAMEPRGVVVDPNLPMGEFTMWTSSQIPHIVRTAQDLPALAERYLLARVDEVPSPGYLYRVIGPREEG